jgi:hypothetical protein
MDFIPDSNAWRDTGTQGPDFAPKPALSLELWCKPRAGALSGLAWHDIARKGTYYGLTIEYQAGNYVFAGQAADVTNSGVIRYVYSPSPVVADTTYHLVFTLDTTNLRLYVDGTLVATQALVGNFDVSPSIDNFALGQYFLPANGFDGLIDEVALYDYALTSTQVQAHHAAGTGASGVAETGVYADSRTATVTASGSGTESYSTPVTYTDAASGTLTASGSGVEARVYADDATYYDNVLDVDSPTSHWKLGDPSTAVDRKGVLNLPAVSGPITSVSGLLTNNSADPGNTFAGATQRFGLPDVTGRGLPYETATWTIEAWIKPAAIGTQQYALRRDRQAILMSSGGVLRFQFADGAGGVQILPLADAVVGTIYHIVATYDGTNVIAYVNGVEYTRLASATVLAAPDTPPTLGADRLGGLPFTGTVDEAAWYPTALTAARVLAHYQAGTVPAGVTASGAGTVTVSGTGTESYVSGATYTDAGTATVTASGTGTESATYADASTATATVTGTGTESAASADTGSGTVTASGTGAETATYVDNGSGTLTSSGTGTEQRVYPDSGTVTGTASGTGTESYVYSDSGTATLAASGSGTDAPTGTDASTATVTASGSVSETYASTDSRTATATASGTGADAADHSASGTATVTASGTGVESYAYPDARTATATTSGSGAEVYAFSDSASGSVSISGSGAEVYAFGDSQTSTTTVSGSGTESYASSDAANGVITVGGYGVEGGAILYVDSASGTVTVSGTSTESATYSDAASGTATASGTAAESAALSYSDATSGTYTVAGTATESATGNDAADGTVAVTGYGVEGAALFYNDTASGTVTVTGYGIESAALSYSDAASGTATISGAANESATGNDARVALTLVSGTSVESHLVSGRARMLALVI